MADVIPNYDLEYERLDLDISQLELNIKSQKYRIIEMEDEKNRITNNMEATQKSIEELKIKRDGLKKDK